MYRMAYGDPSHVPLIRMMGLLDARVMADKLNTGKFTGRDFVELDVGIQKFNPSNLSHV